MKLHCKGCGASHKEDFSFPMNIGEVSDQTGWHFIFVGDGTTWSCPNCWDSIHAMAKHIYTYIWGEVCTEEHRFEKGDIKLSGLLAP
jgi:hypothetical protein